jgi:hypothetical protein
MPRQPSSPDPIDNTPPAVPARDYRPVERFWPYLGLPEQPTDEELAALSPELSEALFGTPKRPFSMSVEFSPFEGPEYDRALAMARASAEYREFRVQRGFAIGRVSTRTSRPSCATCSRSCPGSIRPTCSWTIARCRTPASCGSRSSGSSFGDRSADAGPSCRSYQIPSATSRRSWRS